MNHKTQSLILASRRGIQLQRVLQLCLVFALLIIPLTQASATLLGDFIDGEMIFKNDPNLGNLFDPAPKAGCPTCVVPAFPASSSLQPAAVVLDPDVIFPEFVFHKLGEYNLEVDIDANSVDVSLINTSGSPASSSPEGWEIRLTDINWNDGVPGILTSASIVDPSLFPGLSVSVINSGTGLLLDYPGSSAPHPNTLSTYNNNNQLAATIVFTTQPAVPEPTTLATLGIGVVTLLLRRDRRV